MDAIAGVSRETRERLEIYQDLLLDWQKQINLVGNSTIEQIESRHFADCLQFEPLLWDEEVVADLGSGGGFPGLIIAMLLTEKREGTVHLIESVGKKCAFMREVTREAGMRETSVDVHIHYGRIETVLSELTDLTLITARALSSLDRLLDLTKGRIADQTRALFQKGANNQKEIDFAKRRWVFSERIHQSKLCGESVIVEVRDAVSK